MPTPPTGTVTFLFTDIEGSTALAQAHPAEWEGARQRHHAILRQAVESHQGYVFQDAGDAFCIAFPTAPAAFTAALTAQRALQAEIWADAPIRVRMGLHTGAAEARGGDYQGYLTLSHAQRVMAIASGGQTLVSSATAGLLSGQLPDGVTLRDMGEHRLKGLPNPEHVWQLVAAGLSSDFPPLQSLNTVPNNLPIQVTSFIGREQEMSELKPLLPTTHLVTLTGSGGTGKTRLALQLAAEGLDKFKDGVWFVELAPLRDPLLVPQAVTTALRLRAEERRAVLDTLLDYLREKELLLILDNCEHLIEACAALATNVLRICPRVKLLATSREPLDVAGETLYRVPSLVTPDPHHLPPLERLRQYDAVQLFYERAPAALPSFRLTPANAPAVAQLCTRLDGMPLAIELAAARVKSLHVAQISERLDDRFRLLTGGSRSALPRHQTLRATVDWSYELLSEAERVLLRRLSVFAGGWTIEAAEAVCADEQGSPGQTLVPQPDVLELLLRLVDKSLVVLDEQSDSESRYRMLETIRQYSREKLGESGEANSVRSRQLDFFAEFARSAGRALHGPQQLLWLRRLDAALDNLRAACDWASESRSIDRGCQLCEDGTYAYMRGYWSEWRDRLLELLARADDGQITLSRATALNHVGWYSFLLGDAKAAYGYYERSTAWLRELGVPARAQLSATLGYYGFVMTNHDLTKARTLTEESLSIARETAYQFMVANALNFLGVILTKQGDYTSAQRSLAECMEVCRAIGDRWYSAHPLFNLGEAWYLLGARAKADAYFKEALVIYRETDDRRHIAMTLQRLGHLALLRSEYAQAGAAYAESLVIWRELGNQRRVAALLDEQGLVAERRGDYTQAASRYRESVSLRAELKQDDAIATSLDAFARLAGMRGDGKRAVRLFGAAEALRERTRTHLPDRLRAEHEQQLVALRARLDQMSFNTAWAEGRVLTLEQAVQVALSNE